MSTNYAAADRPRKLPTGKVVPFKRPDPKPVVVPSKPGRRAS